MLTAKANLTGNLIRKQILISDRQVTKLASLSASEKKSEAEIVRLAIDAYDPGTSTADTVPELMAMLDQRLQEAIQSTQHANQVVGNTLRQLEAVENQYG